MRQFYIQLAEFQYSGILEKFNSIITSFLQLLNFVAASFVLVGLSVLLLSLFSQNFSNYAFDFAEYRLDFKISADQLVIFKQQQQSNFDISQVSLLSFNETVYNSSQDQLAVLNLLLEGGEFYGDNLTQSLALVLELNQEFKPIFESMNEHLETIANELSNFRAKVIEIIETTAFTANSPEVNNLDLTMDICEYDPLGFGPIECEGAQFLEVEFSEFSLKAIE